MVTATVVLFVGAIISWILYSKFKPKEEQIDDGSGSLMVSGLGTVFYTKSVGRMKAVKIASEMKDIVEMYWPEFQQIYNRKDVEYYLSKIYLDTENHMRDGKWRVASLYPLSYVLKINIEGDERHSWKFYFMGELHNLFRSFAFGRDHLYPTDEEKQSEEYKKAKLLWTSAFD